MPVGGVGIGNGNFTGAVYLIDQTVPTVSITSGPALQTVATSAAFVFAAADPVSPSGTSSGVNHVEYQLDGGAFTTATSPFTLSGLLAGFHTVEVRAVDNAGNISTLAPYTWDIDHTPPALRSIVRTSPTTSPTNAGSATYDVTFTEAVTGVDAADFVVSSTGAVPAVIQSVTPKSQSEYLVTVTAGDGTLSFQLIDNGTIVDLVGNHFTASEQPANLLPEVPYTTGFASSDIPAADFNGDGHPDLVVVNGLYATNNLQVYFNNGDGTFRPGPVGNVPNGTKTVVTGDFNGDGKADLAFFNGGLHSGAIMLGNGNGTFQAPVTFALDANVNTIAVGDVNGDGKLDVVAASYSGIAYVLLGNGDGTVKPALTTSAVRSETLRPRRRQQRRQARPGDRRPPRQ